MNQFTILLVAPVSELTQKMLACLRSVGYEVDFCPYLQDMEVMLNRHQYKLVLIDPAAEIKPQPNPQSPPAEHFYDPLIAGIQNGVPLLRHKNIRFMIVFTRMAIHWYQRKYTRDLSLVSREVMQDIADTAEQWRNLVSMIEVIKTEAA